jgi:hypothetical protein
MRVAFLTGGDAAALSQLKIDAICARHSLVSWLEYPRPDVLVAVEPLTGIEPYLHAAKAGGVPIFLVMAEVPSHGFAWWAHTHLATHQCKSATEVLAALKVEAHQPLHKAVRS